MIINPHIFSHTSALISKNDMSAASDSGYVVTASTEYSGAYLSYFAFDGSLVYDNHTWLTADVTTGWLKMQLPARKIPTSYNLTAGAVVTTRTPKNWTFQGSNNDSDWDTLDTVTNETTWGVNEEREFTFSNANSYLYHKIDITAVDGGALIAIAEFKIYGY